MTQGEIEEVMSAVGRPGHRYFALDSCVVERGDVRDVLVGGTLIGSYEVGDKAGRNVLLMAASEDPRVHLGKLSSAFELHEETLRRIRRKYEAGGPEAVIEKRQGGREPLVVGRLEKRLYKLFEQGVSIRDAHMRIKGKASEATVGRARGRWGWQQAELAMVGQGVDRVQHRSLRTAAGNARLR
jgi:hypothetical protein